MDVLPYREPMPEADWRVFFEAHVGRQAIVFETANGQALHDALSGKGENAHNLHYHFVMGSPSHPSTLLHDSCIHAAYSMQAAKGAALRRLI